MCTSASPHGRSFFHMWGKGNTRSVAMQAMVDRAPELIVTKLHNISTLIAPRYFPSMLKIEVLARALNLQHYIDGGAYCAATGCLQPFVVPHWSLAPEHIPTAISGQATGAIADRVFMVGGESPAGKATGINNASGLAYHIASKGRGSSCTST